MRGGSGAFGLAGGGRRGRVKVDVLCFIVVRICCMQNKASTAVQERSFGHFSVESRHALIDARPDALVTGNQINSKVFRFFLSVVSGYVVTFVA